MTETMTNYKNHKNTCSAYSGEISIDDFDTTKPNKKRINNQAEANNLEKTLKRQKLEKKQEEFYKTMTLEELKEMKIISNTNGRPSSTLTDEKWQKEFELRKMFITPFGKEVTRMPGKHTKESGVWNTETQGFYNGATNYQQYCSFINDVLKNIRRNQVDYCYYIYQIEDILKFHYNTLRTRYCDGYWEVWLDR